jgi:uncharacterized repeat protein (TIGR01451 family)
MSNKKKKFLWKIPLYICKLNLTKSCHLLLAMMMIILNLADSSRTLAETSFACINSQDASIENTARADYFENNNSQEQLKIKSNLITLNLGIKNLSKPAIEFINLGIKNSQDNNLFGLNLLLDNLANTFNDRTPTKQIGIAGLKAFLSLAENTSAKLVSKTVKNAVVGGEQVTDLAVLQTLTGTTESSLIAIGLTTEEAKLASQAAAAVINLDKPFTEVLTAAIQASQTVVPAKQAQLQNALVQIQQKSTIKAQDSLQFQFIVKNNDTQATTIEIPNLDTFQQSGITGAGTITSIAYQLGEVREGITQSNKAVEIPAGGEMMLDVGVQVRELPVGETVSSLKINLGFGCSDSKGELALTLLPPLVAEQKNLKTIVGCAASDAIATVEGEPIALIPQGITDVNGNSVYSLGIITDALQQRLSQAGFTQAEAQTATLAALKTYISLRKDMQPDLVAPIVKASIAQTVADRDSRLLEFSDLPQGVLRNRELLQILTGTSKSSLISIGLTQTEAQIVSDLVKETIVASTESAYNLFLEQLDRKIAQAGIEPASVEKIVQAQKSIATEIENLQKGQSSAIKANDVLVFKFAVANRGDSKTIVELPNLQTLQNTALTGSGSINKATYQLGEQPEEIGNESKLITLAPQQQLQLKLEVQVGAINPIEANYLKISLATDCLKNGSEQSLAILPPAPNTLIDPLGEITGCNGQLLENYQGFNVALYDPDSKDATGVGLGELTSLTATELPDNPENKVPKGIRPNIENSNPFFLVDSDRGKYSFLFDEKRGQLDKGKTYILVVRPPENSSFAERRVKLTLGDRDGRVVQYTASSVDGKPISAKEGETTITGTILLIDNAEQIGLSLAVLDLATDICDAQEISITKTGDRAVAEPGDTVLYRLAIKNLASADLNNLSVTDALPQGFQFKEKSLRAESDRTTVNITSTIEGSIVTFKPEISLAKDKVLNIVYAAQLTPDAIRGSGKNSAIVNAQRNDNQFSIKDGPAVYSLDIRTGIVSDCGTIIGRVFEDKNFDGHQQPEEPGIPNAVIFLEDGNRIATDEDGLFSLANVLPGYHTGILDLTSIPDYQIAPNQKFSEGNSKTRIVHLEPNGMVRLNFAVTPLPGVNPEERNKHKDGASESAHPEDKKDENLPNLTVPARDGMSDLPQGVLRNRDSSNITGGRKDEN